jgi:DNA helicase-2/ATP-dependent DNA helicase PcrA
VTGEEKALGRCRGCPSTFDEALLERVKAWRRQEAAERGVPAYVVFTDRTLLALAELDHARAEPWRREDLLEVSGIGAAKLEAYGDALLELLAATS